ncbi:MAG TPA: AraC family transcriptional regulator ligand-binding domain-containing protein [Pseudonocardia sp.]|jgi:AraC-like DNA-binding protein|nr:AraC family transcriptional regulator ligand-binding domain-containing protein [Pseudonocardia sp.]
MRHAISTGLLGSAVGLALREGWDLIAIGEASGIVPLQLTGVSAGLTEDQVLRAVDACRRYTDDDLLGLGARPVPRGTLRMVCFAIASAPDLEDALVRYQRFARVAPGLPGLSLVVEGDQATLAPEPGTPDPDNLLVTVSLLVIQRALSWLIGKDLAVRRIEFPYPEPADTAELEWLFAVPLRFDAPRGAIVMHSEMLAAPNMQTEQSLLQFLEVAPSALMVRSPADHSASYRVRRAIERSLRAHRSITGDELAQQLSMSGATLRRKLNEEGTSLREVRDDVLRRAAVASLRRGGEPIATLSERLGFSEPSAFTRAFRRWTGASPAAYRRAVAGSRGRAAVP